VLTPIDGRLVIRARLGADAMACTSGAVWLDVPTKRLFVWVI